MNAYCLFTCKQVTNPISVSLSLYMITSWKGYNLVRREKRRDLTPLLIRAGGTETEGKCLLLFFFWCYLILILVLSINLWRLPLLISSVCFCWVSLPAYKIYVYRNSCNQRHCSGLIEFSGRSCNDLISWLNCIKQHLPLFAKEIFATLSFFCLVWHLASI